MGESSGGAASQVHVATGGVAVGNKTASNTRDSTSVAFAVEGG